MANVIAARRDLARKIWEYAESFGDSADVLAAMHKERLKGSPFTFTDSQKFIPTAILDSFSSELYFKTLHRLEFGRDVRGHDYERLFKALPAGTQKCVREMYKIRLRKENLRTMSAKAKALTPFDECLANSSQVFQSLRYLYEEPKNLMFYWPLLRLSLRDTIIGICPEWSTMK